jgi:hypothetical protein
MVVTVSVETLMYASRLLSDFISASFLAATAFDQSLKQLIVTEVEPRGEQSIVSRTDRLGEASARQRKAYN